MQGSARFGLMLLLSLASAGCQEEASSPAPSSAPVESQGTAFDVGATGTITGRVVWQGELPQVPSFQVHAYLDAANVSRLRGERPNPNAPIIDPATRGVRQVAVILQQVAPASAKPWQHAPVQVQLEGERLVIAQGRSSGHIGFVKRGADLECLSRDSALHTLRARGAAFFTLPFVEADRPARRRLDKSGLVELSTGAGEYWRRAYLFVLDHPYAALTDPAGQFVLDQVPAGTYQIAAWLPNWHVQNHERDPESAAIVRLTFAPAFEVEQTITMVPGQTAATTFTLSLDQFKIPRPTKK